MFLYAELLHQLQSYMSVQQISQISKAYLFAADAHETQIRSSGEPYITHPIAVATILASMHMDSEVLCAALLHDVVEDTNCNAEDLLHHFGPVVSDLVEGVTKLTKIQFKSKAEAQAENFRKMVLAMAKDMRVIIIKLADRLHNMRTLGVLPFEKRNRIAIETLEIYAPIASRLGMNTFKLELEDLGFLAMFPLRYRVLHQYMLKAKGHRKKLLDKIKQAMSECLIEAGTIDPRVYGREKHLYSIYRKMRDKGLPFAEIMDVYGFHIITENRNDCYRMLGVVHGLYTPVPGRFKDYIAIPKANGYQSLHTTLFGPFGVPVEVQIRTVDMEHQAESGIAAHWLYKLSRKRVTDIEIKTRNWMSRMLDIQSRTDDSLEFIENIKVDLYPSDVFVFTPDGDIVELASGSTVVDFAYAIHTEIGNHTVAIKVNRRLVPLSYVLGNGQTVEVITSQTATPNPSWLNFTITGKAKGAIRHFIKSQQQSESIVLGKRLLSNSLSEFGLNWSKLSKARKKQLFVEFKISDEKQLFEQIGSGSRVSSVVCHQILDFMDVDADQKTVRHLEIIGSEGMQIDFASCCHPIPGDPIRGVIKKGKGLEIHRGECPRLEKMDFNKHPEMFVPVHWANRTRGEYAVKLRIENEKTVGSIASIAASITQAKSNIIEFHASDMLEFCGVLMVTIEVVDRQHLARVIRALRRIRTIIKVTRLLT